jgi:hypothetical protein
MVRTSRFLLLPAVALSLTANAQTAFELVSNGGFEVVTAQPTTFDQLDLVEGWSNVTIGLSDVFDSTAAAKTVGLPENMYGKVNPSEGGRCVGFFAWKDDKRRTWEPGHSDPFMQGWSSYSEYLMTQLTAPLEEGREYAFSMDVMLAGGSDRAVSALGGYFSPEPLKYQHRRFLQERPKWPRRKWWMRVGSGPGSRGPSWPMGVSVS